MEIHMFAKYDMTNKAIISIPDVIKNSGFSIDRSPNSFLRMMNRAVTWVLVRRKQLGLLSSTYHTSFVARSIKQEFNVNSLSVERKSIPIDKLYCQCCGRKSELQTDHIVPLSYGGNNSEKNAQVLCANCHAAKGFNIIDFQQGNKFFFSDFHKVPERAILTPVSTLFSKHDATIIRTLIGFNIRSLYDETQGLHLLNVLDKGFVFNIGYPGHEQVVSDVSKEAEIDWIGVFDETVDFVLTETDEYELFINKLFLEQDSWSTGKIRQRAFDENVCSSKEHFNKLYMSIVKLCNNENRIWRLK